MVKEHRLPDILAPDSRLSTLDWNPQRNRPHRPQVGGNVFPNFPISARRALDKNSIAVVQHHAQAVNLRLDDEGGFLHPVVQLADALEPGARLVRAEGIGQAEDGRGVVHFLELL